MRLNLDFLWEIWSRGNCFFLQNGPIPASFCLFSFFSCTISIQIEKSLDGVLRIRTLGRRMVGEDKTMELWRPPIVEIVTIFMASQSMNEESAQKRLVPRKLSCCQNITMGVLLIQYKKTEKRLLSVIYLDFLASFYLPILYSEFCSLLLLTSERFKLILPLLDTTSYLPR